MNDDPLADGAVLARTAEVYKACRSQLVGTLGTFMESRGLDQGQMVDLLLDLGIFYRSIDYFARVEKPSAGGLRLDFDRLRHDFDDLVRQAKREAELRVKLLREHVDGGSNEREASADG